VKNTFYAIGVCIYIYIYYMRIELHASVVLRINCCRFGWRDGGGVQDRVTNVVRDFIVCSRGRVSKRIYKLSLSLVLCTLYILLLLLLLYALCFLTVAGELTGSPLAPQSHAAVRISPGPSSVASVITRGPRGNFSHPKFPKRIPRTTVDRGGG